MNIQTMAKIFVYLFKEYLCTYSNKNQGQFSDNLLIIHQTAFLLVTGHVFYWSLVTFYWSLVAFQLLFLKRFELASI